MRRPLGQIAICFISYFATAQVGTGTVVAYGFTPQKFVIAADSRAVFDNRPPTDDRCKIAAFGHQFIFATAGAAEFAANLNGRSGSWDNVTEARHVIEQAIRGFGESTLFVSVIADTWAYEIKTKWASLPSGNIQAAAEIGKGLITAGIFAEAHGGTISIAVRELRLINNSLQVIPFECPAMHTCVNGGRDALWQIDAAQPLAPSTSLLDAYDLDLLRVVRLADLVLAYAAPIQTKLGPVSPVGGPIDAVEMWGNGTMQWLYRKSQCAERQE